MRLKISNTDGIEPLPADLFHQLLDQQFLAHNHLLTCKLTLSRALKATLTATNDQVRVYFHLTADLHNMIDFALTSELLLARGLHLHGSLLRSIREDNLFGVVVGVESWHLQGVQLLQPGLYFAPFGFYQLQHLLQLLLDGRSLFLHLKNLILITNADPLQVVLLSLGVDQVRPDVSAGQGSAQVNAIGLRRIGFVLKYLLYGFGQSLPASSLQPTPMLVLLFEYYPLAQLISAWQVSGVGAGTGLLGECCGGFRFIAGVVRGQPRERLHPCTYIYYQSILLSRAQSVYLRPSRSFFMSCTLWQLYLANPSVASNLSSVLTSLPFRQSSAANPACTWQSNVSTSCLRCWLFSQRLLRLFMFQLVHWVNVSMQ